MHINKIGLKELVLLTILLLFSLIPLNAQDKLINGEHLLPHRIEFKEILILPNSYEPLNAWVYITSERVINSESEEERFIVQSMTLTRQGKRVDLHTADISSLGLRSWVIPSNLQNEFETTLDWKQTKNESTVYNVSLWPYVFASITNKEFDPFVLPEYSIKDNQRFHYSVEFEGDTTIVDDSGNKYNARIFMGSRILNKSFQDQSIEKKTRYFVSNFPPYFVGKENLSKINNKWIVSKRWEIYRWSPLYFYIR